MPRPPKGVWVQLTAPQWETVIALLSQEADGLDGSGEDFINRVVVEKRVEWLRGICNEIEPALKRAAGRQ